MKLGKIIFLFSLFFGIISCQGRVDNQNKSNIRFKKPEFKKRIKTRAELFVELGKSVTPMRDVVQKRTYCSSSNIVYRGKVYTVTNRHCCDAGANRHLPDNYKVIGDEALKVIHISQAVDLCILDSFKKRGLTISKKDLKPYDRIFSIGFPWGNPMTVMEGRYQYDQKSCVNYGEGLFSQDVRCVRSNVHNVVIRPGNSGGPMFSYDGKVIGITYAKGDITGIMVTRKQLLRELDISRAVYRRDKRSKVK